MSPRRADSSAPPPGFRLDSVPLPRQTDGYAEVQQYNDQTSADSHSPFIQRRAVATKNGAGNEQPSSPRNYLYDWWLWELLSILLSVASLVAVIVILRVYDERPLPNWPHGITLNALVAVMSAIMKASMMVSVAACISQLKWVWFRQPNSLKDFDLFDVASRGPWGSLRLLFRVYFSRLVAVGAFITVLAMAIDPFMQQIISFPLRTVPSTGTASIARAQVYSELGDIHQFGGGVDVGPGLGTKAAVYRGLFTEEVTPIEPSCSTGNCTFPLFDSLAICSKCQNVTDDTTRSYKTGRVTGEQAFGSGRTLNLTYSLPGSVEIKVVAFYSDDEMTSLSYGPALVSVTNASVTMSKDTLGISSPLLSFATLQFPGVDMDGYRGNYLKETPLAYECALYFCVQTYNVTVTNTKTETQIVSTWYNDTAPNAVVGADDRILQRPADQPIAQMPNAPNATFNIPGPTFDTALWYLNKTISGTALIRTSEVRSDDEAVNEVLQALQSSRDVGALMGNLTTSYTNQMREMDSARRDGQVYGETLTMVPHVRVKWAWLSLPALLVGLSIMFQVTTMVIAKDSGVPEWKESSLAVLFHGLGGQLEKVEHAEGLNRTSQMNQEGRLRKVALGKDSYGEWKLQDTAPLP